jgi:hypothetical protein
VAAFELFALGYFVLQPLAAALAPRGRGRWRAMLAGAAMAVVVLLAARLPLVARAWLGHLYLATAYWVPALAAQRGYASRFERWLVASDRRWQARLKALPRPLVHAGEAAYLFCYPFVPAAFLVVLLQGTPADVDRFWLAVLPAGGVCYVGLPWLVARPPRLLPGSVAVMRGLPRLNAIVLSRVSHNLTTFPSGHVAVSVAATCAVAPVSPLAAALLGIVAAGIALGAAAGRYHYVVDVMGGVGVGLMSSVLGLLWFSGA